MRTHMSRAIGSAVLMLACACTPAKEDAASDTTAASSTALPAIDTLKVATPTTPARDSTPVSASGTTPVAGSKTATKTAPVATKTTKKDSIIGRDHVTPLDPNRKLLDTVKKRPPR
jgi:hypothetical protein